MRRPGRSRARQPRLWSLSKSEASATVETTRMGWDGKLWEPNSTRSRSSSLVSGDSLICPETSRFSYLGAKTLNNFSVKHYTDGNGSSTLDSELSPTGSANNNSLGINEFWIDNSGQIVQHLRTIMPGDTTTGGLPQTSTTQMRTVFADVGEANTITAPVVSSQ